MTPLISDSSSSFLTIVEVFPPSFSADDVKEPIIGLKQKSRDFVERVRRIESLADAILVADVKDPSRLKLSSIQSAALLRDKVGIEAIPVITVRDSNRSMTMSSVLTALSLGLTHIMLVWGDRYSDQDRIRNVYNFRSLSDVIRLTRRLADRSGTKCTLLAPVDISSLAMESGRRLARARLDGGADYLLAQPPTSDASSTLQEQETILRKLGLKEKVLPNVFPFRDAADIRMCRTKFGWDIPERLVELADQGEAELLKEAKKVAGKVRDGGFPGVYVSTRGRPELARFVLD
jgi:5,10-methylenetetrahydrofolate reductase